MATFTRIAPRYPSEDLPRTIEFYTQKLGFNLDLAWPEEAPTFCLLERDQVTLGFFAVTDSHCRGPVTIGASELFIEIEDAQGLFEAIKGQVTIDWGPEVYFYGRREFAVKDPDGYLLIFSEETDDPPTVEEE